MKYNDRQKEILAITEKKQKIRVAQLAKALDVSEMTVRRDLEVLARDGLLRRYHGGAIANQEYMQYPINRNTSKRLHHLTRPWIRLRKLSLLIRV